MFRRIKFLIPILLLMMPSIAYAAPGDISNPYDGFVTYDSGHTDFGMAIAVGASGKIVVGADSYNEAGQSKPRGLVATEEEIRQFFANYIERCAQKDIGGLLALFSHSAVQNQRDGFDEIRGMYSDLFNQSQELRYHMEDTGIDIYQNAVVVRARCRVDQVLKKGGERRAWKGQARWILLRENGALKIRYLDDSVEGLFLHGSLAYFISNPGYRPEKLAMRGESGGPPSGEGGNGSDGDDSSGKGDDSGSGGGDDGSGGGDDGSGGDGDDGSDGSDDDGGKGKGKDKGGGKGKGKGE